MRLLALETATRVCSAALAEGDRVVAELNLDIGKVHAEKLAPCVDWLLKQVGWTAEEIDAVAVSQGPGSFTGLRIGLSFAKGFALPRSAGLVLVPTLQALAFRAGPTQRPVCILLRARRGELYMGIYEWRGDEPVELWEPRVVPESDLVEALPEGALLTGELDQIDPEVLERARSQREVALAPEWVRAASAGAVALLGLRRAERGQFADLRSSEPFYLQEFVAKKPRALV